MQVVSSYITWLCSRWTRFISCSITQPGLCPLASWRSLQDDWSSPPALHACLGRRSTCKSIVRIRWKCPRGKIFLTTFQEDRLLFPRVSFVGFFNFSERFSVHWARLFKYHLTEGPWTTEVTCSNVFLLAFLLTYSSNSSGFAFRSRDISAYWASSPATKNWQPRFFHKTGYSRFFSLTAREVEFQASLWPSPSLFPHDASWLFMLWQLSELPLKLPGIELDRIRPAAGWNLHDGDWGQVGDCVREESMQSGNHCGKSESFLRWAKAWSFNKKHSINTIIFSYDSSSILHTRQ